MLNKKNRNYMRPFWSNQNFGDEEFFIEIDDSYNYWGAECSELAHARRIKAALQD